LILNVVVIYDVYVVVVVVYVVAVYVVVVYVVVVVVIANDSLLYHLYVLVFKSKSFTVL
jgi:hypothetical protein